MAYRSPGPAVISPQTGLSSIVWDISLKWETHARFKGIPGSVKRLGYDMALTGAWRASSELDFGERVDCDWSGSQQNIVSGKFK